MSPKAEKRPVRSPRNRAQEIPQQSSSWLDYFRFGESYTSLILGIIVVIVTTVLLVFLVRDRNLTQLNGNRSVSSTNTKNTNNIAQGPTVTPRLTLTPTPSIAPTVTKMPTTRPTVVTRVQATKTPTLTPTRSATPTTRPTVTLKPTATVQPTKVIAQKPTVTPAQQTGQKTYTVVAGDNLWTIAEKYYNSGYNWVDIARVNKLSDADILIAGTTLSIPNVTPKTFTVDTKVEHNYGAKITTNTYKVQKGDHLWGIAVRAYGDGYKWTEIAQINNIKMADYIEVGTELKLPRTNNPPQNAR